MCMKWVSLLFYLNFETKENVVSKQKPNETFWPQQKIKLYGCYVRDRENVGINQSISGHLVNIYGICGCISFNDPLDSYTLVFFFFFVIVNVVY